MIISFLLGNALTILVGPDSLEGTTVYMTLGTAPLLLDLPTHGSLVTKGWWGFPSAGGVTMGVTWSALEES